VFERYHIIDQADLAVAAAGRLNGKQAANNATPNGTPTDQPNPVTSSAA